VLNCDVGVVPKALGSVMPVSLATSLCNQ